MLKIRLARHGRKKAPFYRIVLTEHTKPAQCGYQAVLWSYNPFTKETVCNLEEIKKHISNWAQLTERTAKILLTETKDKVFEQFITQRERKREKRNDKSE